MSIVDLHVHSTRSDGSFTPSELVAYAIEKGLKAFALTDHDTTAGLSEAMEAAKGKPIEVIPGIEFSSEYEGKDIHIVGLYIDYEGAHFQKYIKEFQASRDLRNRRMCEKLTEHGVSVSYEELTAAYPHAILTRAHFAKYLCKMGYVKSMKEAFERYIGDRAPCFLPREKVTPQQTISLILQAGGIPVLAHPILYHFGDAKLDQLVRTLKLAGLVAIEAIYSTYSAGEERQIRALASKYQLLLSGGSDFHGTTKPGLDLAVGYGKLVIPEEILQKMKDYRNYHASILFSDMDGTLLTSDKKISPDTMSALQKHFKQGGKLVLSSGRPLNSILEVAGAFGLDLPGTYMIAYNGSLIYDCDAKTALLQTTVPLKDVAAVMKLAQKYGIYCHSYKTDEDGTETIVSQQDGPELAFYRRNIHLPYEIVDSIADTLSQEPYKLLCIKLEDNQEILNSFQKELHYLLGDRIHSFYSGRYYMECCHKEASKGNAVRFLCDYLKIPLSQAVACGDSFNDIPMLQACGIGVAMKNAMEEVKLNANYISTNDNNHDGIKEVLERFFF